MSNQEVAQLPPVDPDEYKGAVGQPFAHPDALKGAAVDVQYPHTAADEQANRELAHNESIEALSAGSDAERRGLATHQPLAAERPLSEYPAATTPAQTSVTYGRREEDVVAERDAAAVPDEKWDQFVEGHEDDGRQAPRRSRVARIIRGAFRRSGRN